MRRIAIALFGLLFACCAQAQAQAQVAPGDIPPDDLGVTVDGQGVSLTALNGKVVVISFLASWCDYCTKELPVLTNLQNAAAARGLQLQVIAVDYREDRDTFERYARQLQARDPSLLVSWDRDGSISRQLGAGHRIPIMVMLHRNGSVAYVHVGYGESMLNTLVAEVNDLLREPAQPGVAAN